MPPSRTEFFDALWADVKGTYWAVLGFVDPPSAADARPTVRHESFVWPSNSQGMFERADGESKKSDVFFGVCARTKSASGDLDADRGAAFGIPAFWTTFNLKILPLDKAIARVKAFRFQPSAGVLAGDILQVYWFLKDLLDEEPDVAWAANSRLGNILVPEPELFGALHDPLLVRAGLQAEHYGVLGLLRLPGAPNRQCDPPKAAEIVSWNFDVRHSFDEFVGHLVDLDPDREDDAPPAPPEPPRPAPPKEEAAKPPEAGARNGSGRTEPGVLDVAAKALEGAGQPEEIIAVEFVQSAAKELSPCWKGYAESFAMPLFGTLGRLVSSATLARLVQRVCADAADANEQKWMDLVDSTVARLETDRPTQGISSLDQALKKTPTFVAKAVRKVVALAKKAKATDAEEAGNPEDLQVMRIRRKPLEEPEYVIDFEYKDAPGRCTVDDERLLAFKGFKASVLRATKQVLILEMSDIAWQRKVASVEIEDDPSLDTEAPQRQVLKDLIVDILSSRGVVEDLSELTTSTIYMNGEYALFKWDTIKVGLKHRGANFPNRDVMLALQELKAERAKKDEDGRYWKIPKGGLKKQGNLPLSNIGEKVDDGISF